jgi:DNA-binding NarL/FixJ family response regulator
VLVIDDQPQVRGPIRIRLQSLGHEVMEAADGVQGLECYRTARPDVVLMDIYMPEKDGIETLRDLLALDPGATILAMSGGGSYSNVRILEAASQMGAKGILTKPFAFAEMMQAIARVTAPPPAAADAATPADSPA